MGKEDEMASYLNPILESGLRREETSQGLENEDEDSRDDTNFQEANQEEVQKVEQSVPAERAPRKDFSSRESRKEKFHKKKTRKLGRRINKDAREETTNKENALAKKHSI